LTGTIVADAGPLIALARIDRLGLLAATGFSRTLIPSAVHEELRLGSGLPGTAVLAEAFHGGGLSRRDPPKASPAHGLVSRLGRGEAEAILLAYELKAPLLIDERLGRREAARLGLSVLGVGGLLLRSIRRGLDVRMEDSLTALAGHGYRLSAQLRIDLLERERTIREGLGE
jgi:uncharacterized protein